jgi:tetratricopeptide (TPR) repeat protein
MSVTGDLQRAVDTLELACETYPLDRIFLRDLGFVQIEMGRLEESLETYHKAVLISSDGITKLMYLQALMRLDRFKEASTTLAEVQPLLVNSTGYAICRYNLHVLTGNLPAMTRDISAVKTSALAQEFLGQYGEAEKSWDRGAAQCAARGAKDTEAICLVYRLFGRAYAGIDSDSAQILKSALALDNTKETLATVSITAAVCHQPSIALPIMEDLAKKYPEDTLITRVVLPQCRAALALGNHEPKVAVRELEGSESFDCVSQRGYLRGLAYLDLKDGPDAVAAFQNAARYRGEPLIDSLQNHGQAQLGLARAYVLCGDRVSAKKAYEDLLDLWKNADADLPQLVAAKREYASLSASSAATVGSTR